MDTARTIDTTTEQFQERMTEVKRSFVEFRDHKLESLRKQPEYKNSTLLYKLDIQREQRTFGDFLVCAFSDIDGTYIFIQKLTKDESNGETADEKKVILIQKNHESITNTTQLTRWLDEHNVPIVGVSGRALSLIQNGQIGGVEHDVEQLPLFDLAISSVGTHIDVLQQDGSYTPDEQFLEYVENTISFNRTEVYEACKEVVGQFAGNTDPANPALRFQTRDSEANVEAYASDLNAKDNNLTTEEAPLPFKISFNYDQKDVPVALVKQRLAEEFVRRGKPGIKIIVSRELYAPNGVEQFNIDIVPVSKLDAIQFIVKKLGCLAAFSGDTGNDLDAITGAGNAGAMMGNRKPELDQVAREVYKKHAERQTTRKVFTGRRLLPVSPEDHPLILNPRLLYVDSTENKGPKSELRALRTFSLLLKMMSEESRVAVMEELMKGSA